MEKGKMTPASEQAILSRLSQKSIAWLCDKSTKSVSEWNIQRNDDATQTYDIRSVIHHLQKKRPATKLPDATVETILQLAERTVCGVSLEACRKLRRLTDNFNGGDDVLLAFARAFLECLKDEWPPEYDGAVTTVSESVAAFKLNTEHHARLYGDSESAVRKLVEVFERDAEQRAAIDNLDVVVQCEKCKKVRQGATWSNRKPSEGAAVLKGQCPTCTAKK